MTYRFLFLLGILCSILASCSLPGTTDEGGSTEDNTVVYQGAGMSMKVPRTWSGVNLGKYTAPHVGTVVAAWISPKVEGPYSNNLVIMKDTLAETTTSKSYSERNFLQTTQKYLEYTKTKESDFSFDDGSVSKLYVFSARYNENTPRMQFLQLARVCGSHVYLLHFTLTLDKNPDIYSDLFKSFTCDG